MAIKILDALDPRQLGEALQKARQQRGLTQAQAAEVIGVARTTLTAIEKGERRIREGELLQLASAYGRSVSDFVRSRPPFESFVPQYRGPQLALVGDPSVMDKVVAELEEMSRLYVELETLTENPLIKNYPPLYSVSGLAPEVAAEMIATRERQRLGLGDGSLPRLRELLEQDVGLRIFYLPMPTTPNFSAVYSYTESMGGCIAINRAHPEERRRWSLSHEYAHFLAHRYQPEVSIDGEFQRKPENERFADSFANHFLMPTTGLTRRFHDLARATGRVTPADLCALAHFYGVSMAAMSYRLEELNLLPAGTWDRIHASGFKVREAQQQLGLPPLDGYHAMLPMRYQYLAVSAYDQEELSEGQLARFLRVSRVQARDIVQKIHNHLGDGAATDAVALSFDLLQTETQR